MTLEEILAQMPEELRPVVSEYGPALVEMSTGEIWLWINLLLKGDTETAYRLLLTGMDTPERLDEWSKLASDWDEANIANKQKMNLMREASVAILRVLLTVALALVGL